MSRFLKLPAPALRCALPSLVLALPVHGQALLTVYGEPDDDNLGSAVSRAGDVNGDGHDDFIAGADEAAPGGSANDFAKGLARIYSGKDGTVLFAFHGIHQNDQMGRSVSWVGDVNLDGIPDVVVSAPFEEGAGSVRVYSGKNGKALHKWTGAEGDAFGSAVSGASDVDLDGRPDVLVGASGADANGTNSGEAWVFSGADGDDLLHLEGDAAGYRFGNAVSGGLDANADGYPDLVVGAMRSDVFGDDSGSVSVWSGKQGNALYVFHGDQAHHRLGWSVAAAGDLNGDGCDDFLAGTPNVSDAAPGGTVRAWSGKTGQILHSLTGPVTFTGFGHSLAAAGDLDQDGFHDFLVGSESEGKGASSAAGAVRLFSGKDAQVLALGNGESSFDHLGRSVAGGLDLNADGRLDFLAGAPTFGLDLSEPGVGSVRAFSGVCGTIAAYGQSCPGSGFHWPKLLVTGCPAPGAPVQVAIQSGLGGSPALLFASLAQAALPLGGGCKLYLAPFPSPLLFAGTLSTGGPGQGELFLPANIPHGFHGTVTLQAFLQDPGAQIGWTTTHGIELTVP